MDSDKKLCTYCQTEIPKKASICPQCRKDVRNWFSKHPIVTFLFILLIIWVIWSNSWGTKNTNNDETLSCTYSQEVIKNNLKSPSTAKFPYCNKYDISKTEKWYLVKWYVDSENSFWAMIRSYFTCDVEVTSDKINPSCKFLD